MTNQNKLEAWTVLESKIVHQTPWIEIKEDLCKADGQELSYTYSRRVDEGPLIIAESNDKKLWLVRQYRHPIKKIIWQFPGEGKLVGESWEDAARRGLKEELQVQADSLVDLGVFHPDPGGLEQKFHAYLATGLSTLEATASASESATHAEVENLEIASFSRAEIDQFIDAGEVCDNWTLAALFLYDRAKRG